MSNIQVTQAAKREWLEFSSQSYPAWIAQQKSIGRYWGANDE